MRLLVTGGTGFIGRHFIDRFPEYDYLVLTRSPAKANRLLPDNVETITSLDQLENLDGFDAVINLCGESIGDRRWTLRQKERICQSRWQPTHKLAELLQRSENPPAAFLSGSAIGYYGDTGHMSMNEDFVPQVGDFAQQVCAQWEHLAERTVNLTRLVLLRTAVVLAGDGGALPKMALPFRLGMGGRMGSGNQYMSWIHIDDMVQAMNTLLCNDMARGPFNLCAPGAVTNRGFSEQLAQQLNTRPHFPVPAWSLRFLLGEAAGLVLNSQRIYPRNLLNIGFQFQFPDIESALTAVFAK